MNPDLITKLFFIFVLIVGCVVLFLDKYRDHIYMSDPHKPVTKKKGK